MRAFFIASAILFLASVCHGTGVGSNPCTWGPAYWCRHVGTMKECGETEYCSKHWMKLVTNAIDEANNLHCLQCKMQIGQLRKLSKVKPNKLEIGKEFGNFCQRLPVPGHCQAIADAYLHEILLLIKFGLSDSQLCQALNVCKRRDPKP